VIVNDLDRAARPNIDRRGGRPMELGSVLQRLRTSFVNSAGTIVFGMEDGTVSIFGLIFGVAATTTDPKTVLIAGASGAAAAAVSMMAGTYLDVETTRDEAKAIRALHSTPDSIASLSNRLGKAGLTAEQSEALTGAVQNNPKAVTALLLALGVDQKPRKTPWSRRCGCWLRIFSRPQSRSCLLSFSRSSRRGLCPAPSRSPCSLRWGWVGRKSQSAAQFARSPRQFQSALRQRLPVLR
jgi:VIT family